MLNEDLAALNLSVAYEHPVHGTGRVYLDSEDWASLLDALDDHGYGLIKKEGEQ